MCTVHAHSGHCPATGQDVIGRRWATDHYSTGNGFWIVFYVQVVVITSRYSTWDDTYIHALLWCCYGVAMVLLWCAWRTMVRDPPRQDCVILFEYCRCSWCQIFWDALSWPTSRPLHARSNVHSLKQNNKHGVIPSRGQVYTDQRLPLWTEGEVEQLKQFDIVLYSR